MDLYNEDLNLGDPTAWQGTPDCKWDNANKKLKIRSLILGDIGDPSDLCLRRAGPDGATPQGPPAALEANANIGLGMYWQAFGSQGDFDSTTPGRARRNAQIYARCRGAQTNENAGGSLHLATTTVGKDQIEDVLELESDGTFRIGKAPVVYNLNGDPNKAGIRCRMPNGRVGYLVVQL